MTATPQGTQPRTSPVPECPECGQPIPPKPLLCTCGHMRGEHNIETRAMPCSRYRCGCKRFIDYESAPETGFVPGGHASGKARAQQRGMAASAP